MAGMDDTWEKQVYSFQEFRERSGFGRDYLREALRTGRLRSIKVGRTHRIPKAELSAFVQRELESQ